jgi:integrase
MRLQTDPTIDLVAPSVKNNLPKPIPDADWRALYSSDLSDRLFVALGLGYYVGLRRAEIASLHGKQINKGFIEHFIRKGGGEDTLPWLDLVRVIQDGLPEVDVLTFDFQSKLAELASANLHSPITYQDGGTIHREMIRACKLAGIPKYTPHQLRHSCATNLVRTGMPLGLVASMMNHSSIDITRGYARLGGGELADYRRSLDISRMQAD